MEYQVGAKAHVRRTVTEADIVLFAGLSGDTNPVHLDEISAQESRFGRRIAHGMYSAALISAVLGTRLPGPGTIYLSQTLQFRHPAYIGDTLTAQVEIIKRRDDKPLLTLQTIVTNQEGTLVAEGEAVVLAPA